MWLLRLFRRKPASAPIDEHEAYARSYGERSGDIIRVAPVAVIEEPPAPDPFEDLTGELLRRAFETRLDARR